MRKGALTTGLGILLVGGYLFILSMMMIMDYTFQYDWVTWTIYLTLGIVLVSVGPGIIAWAFMDRYQSLYGTAQWQVIRLPLVCPECGHSMEIHSLEWIGSAEARCPFCSNRIEVMRSET